MRKKKQKAKKQFFWERYTEASDPTNFHFLSPLVKAAFQSRLQPFNYKINRENLKFDGGNARDLYAATSEYIKNLKPIIQDAKIKMLRRDPVIRKFLNSTIESHNFPTRLYHVLKDVEAKKMLDVARLWHERLPYKRGMGNESIKILVAVFDKHGCFTLTL